MKKEDVLIADIKVCTDYESYKRYGEERIDSVKKDGRTKNYLVSTNCEFEKRNAVLIRSKHGLVDLSLVDSLYKEILISCGIPFMPMYTSPTSEGCKYVDASSIKPFFATKKDSENQTSEIGFKELKSIVERRENNTTVSVIVPVFNSEKYLRDTLDSLVGQTLDGLEIIVVDDASEDFSLGIAQSYQKFYPDKIRVIRNSKNMGQSYSRNKGLMYATGKYVAFLDSDDYVSADMYKRLYEGALQHPEADVIVTGLIFVHDSSYLNKPVPSFSSNGNLISPSEQVLDQSPSVCNKLFKKEFLNDKRFLEGVMWEDVAFTYSSLFSANKILIYQNPDYYYRKRMDEGVSSKGFVPNPDLLDIFDIADALETETKKTGVFEKFEKEIRFLELVTTLQRLAEILNWQIDDEDKKTIIRNMYRIISHKYASLDDYPLEVLSSRVGFLELERIKSIVLDEEKEKTESESRKEISSVILKYTP